MSSDEAALASELPVWIQAAATIILVLVTIYYAYQNKRMAAANKEANRIAQETLDELRTTRLESLRPHLALSLEFIAPTYVNLRVTNLGAGAARNLQAEVTFVPSDDGFEADVRKTRVGVLLPAQHIEFRLPTDATNSIMSAGHFVKHFGEIRSVGQF